jgi:hypothetical protein
MVKALACAAVLVAAWSGLLFFFMRLRRAQGAQRA